MVEFCTIDKAGYILQQKEASREGERQRGYYLVIQSNRT